jgi:uncharacterized protein with gpF-like domain
MIDWTKLQPLYERKAYRIVQKHVKAILNNIAYKNATLGTYEWLIDGNITEEQIYKMFVEIYSTIGLNYGNRVNKEIEKTKKANMLFNEFLLKEILLYLSTDGGVKIASVRDTLVADLIKAIKESLGENATVIDLQNAIYNIVSKSQTFYKWQALRIARTETTSASGLAAMKTAEQSDLVMTKEWVSVTDNRTRNDHRIENGQVADLEDTFIMASGIKMQYPGDPKAPAKEVINCRCTVAFKAKRDAEGNLIFKK